MDAALVIGFNVAVALLTIRVRRANLAVAAVELTAMLALALIAQGAWASDDEEPEAEA